MTTFSINSRLAVKSWFAAGMVCLSIVTIEARAHGAESIPIEEPLMVPDEVTIRHAVFRSEATRYYSGSFSRFGEKGNIDRALGVTIGAYRDLDVAWSPPKANSFLYRVEYPPLACGDVIPMFGVFYRIVDFNYPGGNNRKIGGSVQFRRVLTEELGAKANLERDSFYFPIDGGGRLHRTLLLGIKVVDTSKERIPTKKVTIKTMRDNNDLPAYTGPTGIETQTVVVGDLLRCDDKSHQVRNIVLPNRQKKMIGWIEVDPHPAEAARED